MREEVDNDLGRYVHNKYSFLLLGINANLFCVFGKRKFYKEAGTNKRMNKRRKVSLIAAFPSVNKLCCSSISS